MNATRTYQVVKKNILVNDEIAVEIPIQLILNSKKIVVSMCSPTQLKEWAVGFLFTEGYIQSYTDIIGMEVSEVNNQFEISVDTHSEIAITNTHSLLSVTACGICGKTEFNTLVGSALKPKNQDFNMENLMLKLKSNQIVFQATGATHAVAVFDEVGNILVSAEDVGRHNAVDKCVGMLLISNSLNKASVILTTSRVSYEIVAKTFKAKIPNLIAVSAPTSLAIDYCKELGIRLIGFWRSSGYTEYS